MADPTDVSVSDGTELLATHPRSYDKGAQIEDAAHIAEQHCNTTTGFADVDDLHDIDIDDDMPF